MKTLQAQSIPQYAECNIQITNCQDITVTTSGNCSPMVVTYPDIARNKYTDSLNHLITYTYVMSGATTRSGNGTGSGQVFNTGLTNVTVTAWVPLIVNGAPKCEKIKCNFTTTVICPPCSRPILSCPADIDENTESGKCGSKVEYAASISGETSVSYQFSGATNGSGSGTGSGSFFNTGETIVTLTATNDCGSEVCSFSINITDKEIPNAVCKNIEINLSNGFATISPGDIDAGSTDNCGIVKRSISKSDFSCANIGSNKVELKLEDAAGNISYCEAVVTVNGIVPEVEIIQNNTGFCEGEIELIANAEGGNSFSYLWSTNETTQNISISSDGNYTVSVTNEFGCSAGDNITVDYKAPSTLAAYTIIAKEKVYLKYSSNLKSGGSGVQDEDGKIYVKGNSSISGTGTFAEAVNIEVDNSSTVDKQINSAFDLTLPDFIYNPYCENECESKYHNNCSSECKDGRHSHCKSSCKEKNHSKRCRSKYHKYCKKDCKNNKHIHCKSTCKSNSHNHCKSSNCSEDDHHHCSEKCHSKYHKKCNSKCKNSNHVHCKSYCSNHDHNHCQNSNCESSSNDITVGSNKSVTLNDSIYGNITLGKNSTVTFTSPVIYAKSIKTSYDAEINFKSDCIKLMVCQDISLNKGNSFNPGNKSLLAYVEKSFTAEEGTTVNSSIYSMENIVSEGSSCKTNQMKGIFIAENVESKYTNWNKIDNCGTCKQFKKTSFADEGLENLLNPESISVNIYPNPSKGFFGIDLITQSTGTVNISVTDLMGRVVFKESKYVSGPDYIAINLTDGIAGQYIVKVELKGKVYMDRIMLVK
ncbi:MAG: T9SS type A sorting domain-containing protein [Flavobacteriales bacterium]|nr:T9SS type A sorting domain-containing protein [Flavobacteriales bacterium]